MLEHWGEPPGSLYVDGDDIVLACLRFGNVRADDPAAARVRREPDRDLPRPRPAAVAPLPGRLPLAGRRTFGADAVVHLGKHGTLEWLPGKGLGLSAGCAPDAVLGDLPLVYPFIVNDPGEGTQAKRRGHAIVVDHLVPPMARADTYGEMAKLEQLLDEYATVAALDPAKLPGAAGADLGRWSTAAQLHHDLHVDDAAGRRPSSTTSCCTSTATCARSRTSQIRDGLHILGGAPDGEALVNLVLAVLRAPQVWGGAAARCPACAPPSPRASASTSRRCWPTRRSRRRMPADADRTCVDGPAAHRRRRASTCSSASPGGSSPAWTTRGWDAAAPPPSSPRCSARAGPDVVARAASSRAPRSCPGWPRTTDEIDARPARARRRLRPRRAVRARRPAGWSTCCRPAATSTPSTRRPSRRAASWEAGLALADSLLARHLADDGRVPALRRADRVGHLARCARRATTSPRSSRCSAAARCGTTPRAGSPASRSSRWPSSAGRASTSRVRISGFFRDAFPHVDRAARRRDRRGGRAGRAAESNYVRAHAASRRRRARRPAARDHPHLRLQAGRLRRRPAAADRRAQLARRRRPRRGVRGVGRLRLRPRARRARGARPDMETAFRRIAVAAKNLDTREHDIVDSDDYFQYHGGMVAMVRALTGRSPAAYVGDSAVPDAVEDPHAGRGDPAGVPRPGGQPALDRGDAAARLQGRVRAGRDRRLPVRLRRHRRRRRRLDVRAAGRVATSSTRRTGRSCEQSNPWALRGITERLLEAADRGLWEAPDAKTLDQLRQVYLDIEGDLESRG